MSASSDIATASKTGQTTVNFFSKSHNLNNDLNVTILQNNIKNAVARRYHEDKWICRLKTLVPQG